MSPLVPPSVSPPLHATVAEAAYGNSLAATRAWYASTTATEQQDLAFDAFVVPQHAHVSYFGNAATALDAASASTDRANCGDVPRQAVAHRKACEVASAVGADLDDVLVMRRQRDGVAHFGIKLDAERYFGKAQLTPQAEGWPERIWTARASERGLALPTLQPAQLPEVSLTEWAPQGSLTDRDMVDPAERFRLLARVREIHTWFGSRPAPAWPAEIGASRGHLAGLEQKQAEGPLSLLDLRVRLDWIDAELAALRPDDTFVHGDVALPNVVKHRGAFFFLDWEGAGWGDPFRDPARLISFGRWDNKDLLPMLTAYLGAAPTPAQTRHFALVVAGFDIDHYGNQRGRRPPDQPFVTLWADRVAAEIAELPDMPKVRRTQGPKADAAGPCP